jgi:hypothetical protein
LGRDTEAAVRTLMDEQRAALRALTLRRRLTQAARRERRATERYAELRALRLRPAARDGPG